MTLVLLFFGFCILITSLGFPFEAISFDFESENHVLKIVLYVLCSCVSFVYCVIDFGILVFMESVSDEPFFLGSFMTISITWGFS